jgi:hypothetical protein
MTDTIAARFLIRRGTKAELAAINEVPLLGEFVYETDQGLSDGSYKIKIGDGVTHYNSLPYIAIGTSGLPMTAKGDLVGYDGTSVIRIPNASADNMVLTSKASSTGGMDWETPSGGGGGGNITADSHPATASAADDEFEFGTGMDTTGARRSGATAWSNFNTVTGSWTVNRGSLCFKPFITTVANFNGYTQSVSGSTWEYTAKMEGANLNANCNLGIFVGTASGTAGKFIMLGMNQSVSLQKWNSATSFNSAPFTGTIPNQVAATGVGTNTIPFYFRIKYDGTNLIFSFSLTGIEGSYIPVLTETPATFLGTPAIIGIGGQQSATVATAPILICDWFRKTA